MTGTDLDLGTLKARAGRVESTHASVEGVWCAVKDPAGTLFAVRDSCGAKGADKCYLWAAGELKASAVSPVFALLRGEQAVCDVAWGILPAPESRRSREFFGGVERTAVSFPLL